MKKRIILAAFMMCILSGCSLNKNNDDDIFINPGDSLGGGKVATDTPVESSDNSVNEALNNVLETGESLSQVPSDATQITDKYEITSPGNYYVSTTITNKKITVSSQGVTLYLNNANLSNEKKVIESSVSFTLTLIGDNTISNSNESGSNAIDCEGDLIINGPGSLTISSTKNGISANRVIVKGATLDIEANKDGIHAEIGAYDDLETVPSFSYEAGGYVYLENANITINSLNDGIQGDTFVYIKESTLNILTNGGAPTNITETSSDNGEGKGIKAGTIDWGSEDKEISGDYLVYIEGGNTAINANDDAIHSNGELVINGGTYDITSGDDGIHSETLLKILAGNITINNSYEGIESAKVEISGGEINVKAVDDGINAADGSKTQINVANNNCHIIISGATISVNANGDGVDSNGSILISGGTLFVSGSTNGADAALDADGNIIVNG